MARPDVVEHLSANDQIKVHVIYRILDQTLGYLSTDDIGVTAKVTDATRQLDNIDTHKESVVEEGVHASFHKSGILRHQFERQQLDALICGHAVNFSSWREVEEEQEVQVPEFSSQEGMLIPALDENGEPKLTTRMEKQVVFSSVKDERISPAEFLFDASAPDLSEAAWLGYERIVELDSLKQDSRFDIPEHIKGSSLKRATLAGDNDQEQVETSQGVLLIVIWNSNSRKLKVFIDNTGSAKKGEQTLFQIAKYNYPVKFDHPDDSPFNVFIPKIAMDSPYGVSAVEHIRLPALEADILRTRRSNLARKQKRILAYNKDKLDSDEVETALNSDEDIVSIGFTPSEDDKPNISSFFSEIQTAGPPDALLQFSKEPEDDARKISGVSEIPFGGADTATESENQQKIGQARVNKVRTRMFKYLTQVARTHIALLREFMPEGNHIPVTLPNGQQQVLEYGASAFKGDIHIDIGPSGGASQLSPVRQKMLMETVGLSKDMLTSPEAKLILMREVYTQLDVRNVNAILEAERRSLMAPPAPEPGQPQAPLSNPQNDTNGQTISQAINPYG
jgi:hypothetical protein